MNSTRYVGIAIGLLVVLLLILLNRPPDDLPLTQPGQRATPESAAPDLPIPAPARLPSEPETGTAGSRQGRVVTTGDVLVDEGRVDFFGAAQPEGMTYSSVVSGFFAIPDGWILKGIAPESFEYRTPNGCPSRIVACSWNGELLQLRVGARRELEVFVHDLAGNPIVEAEVQVFAPLPYRGERVETSQDGTVRIVAYSDDARLAIRVVAEGYARSALAADTQAVTRLEVPLGRLFGIGIIQRRSPAMQDMGGVLPGDGHYGVLGRSLAEFETQMRAAHPVPSYDELLFVNLVAETRWLEEPPVLQLSYAPRGRGQEFKLGLQASFLPLLKGIPKVIRVPDTAYPEVEAVYSVVVRLLPRNAFLADPPDSLFLRFIRAGAADEPWDQRGYQISDTQFRFLLPTGDFEVRTLEDEWDFYEGSNPRILPGTKISVGPDIFLEYEVTLAPDERYFILDLRSSAGRETSIGALLAPSDGKPRRFSPNSESFPYGRFIRPGMYDLWFMNFASLKPEKLLEGLIWPASMEPGGRWVLRAPADRFPAAAFASMMR